jgi:predicted DNA-binding protein YlxM (UPF0122 family)
MNIFGSYVQVISSKQYVFIPMYYREDVSFKHTGVNY